VVVKPSELTPLTALAAAELALQAGIPPVSPCNFHVTGFFEQYSNYLPFCSCLGFPFKWCRWNRVW